MTISPLKEQRGSSCEFLTERLLLNAQIRMEGR